MLWKRSQLNLRNQIASRTVETSLRLARERSRIKPEDITRRRFLFGVGNAVLSFFKRLFGFFRGRAKHFKPIVHAKGYFGKASLNSKAPKWFRALQKWHLGELPFIPGNFRSPHKAIARLS